MIIIIYDWLFIIDYYNIIIIVITFYLSLSNIKGLIIEKCFYCYYSNLNFNITQSKNYMLLLKENQSAYFKSFSITEVKFLQSVTERQSRNLPFNKSDHRSRFRTCRFARPTFLFSLKWAFNFPRFKEKILNFSVKINSIKYVYYKERQYNIIQQKSRERNFTLFFIIRNVLFDFQISLDVFLETINILYINNQ